jgi:hypothetical protein
VIVSLGHTQSTQTAVLRCARTIACRRRRFQRRPLHCHRTRSLGRSLSVVHCPAQLAAGRAIGCRWGSVQHGQCPWSATRIHQQRATDNAPTQTVILKDERLLGGFRIRERRADTRRPDTYTCQINIGVGLGLAQASRHLSCCFWSRHSWTIATLFLAALLLASCAHDTPHVA